jgi:hypothetical protein
MNLSRRTFIVSDALAPVACGGLSYEQGIPVTQPKPLPVVRSPQVGQEWTYIKKNIFDGKTLDVITERVANIGSTIVIDRSTADGARLPSEIQTSWGMVATNTQWSRLLNFSPSLPLWPEQLGRWVAREISGSYRIQGQVSTAILEGSYQWQLSSYK